MESGGPDPPEVRLASCLTRHGLWHISQPSDYAQGGASAAVFTWEPNQSHLAGGGRWRPRSTLASHALPAGVQSAEGLPAADALPLLGLHVLRELDAHRAADPEQEGDEELREEPRDGRSRLPGRHDLMQSTRGLVGRGGPHLYLSPAVEPASLLPRTRLSSRSAACPQDPSSGGSPPTSPGQRGRTGSCHPWGPSGTPALKQSKAAAGGEGPKGAPELQHLARALEEEAPKTPGADSPGESPGPARVGQRAAPMGSSLAQGTRGPEGTPEGAGDPFLGLQQPWHEEPSNVTRASGPQGAKGSSFLPSPSLLLLRDTLHLDVEVSLPRTSGLASPQIHLG